MNFNNEDFNNNFSINNQYNLNDYKNNNHNYKNNNFSYNTNNNDFNKNNNLTNMKNSNNLNPIINPPSIFQPFALHSPSCINFTFRRQFFGLQLIGFIIFFIAIILFIQLQLLQQQDISDLYALICNIVLIIYCITCGVYLLLHIIFFFILDMPILTDFNCYLMRQWTQKQKQKQQQIIDQQNQRSAQRAIYNYNTNNNQFGDGGVCCQPGVQISKGFLKGLVCFVMVFLMLHTVMKYICYQKYRIKLQIIRKEQYLQKIQNKNIRNTNNKDNVQYKAQNSYYLDNTNRINNHGLINNYNISPFINNNSSPFINNNSSPFINNNGLQLSNRNDIIRRYP